MFIEFMQHEWIQYAQILRTLTLCMHAIDRSQHVATFEKHGAVVEKRW